MAQTFGFMLYILGLESQVLGLGLGLVAYVLGLAICVLDSITGYYLKFRIESNSYRWSQKSPVVITC